MRIKISSAGPQTKEISVSEIDIRSKSQRLLLTNLIGKIVGLLSDQVIEIIVSNEEKEQDERFGA